jgi:benzil reductase ((S)-benzoin forming)
MKKIIITGASSGIGKALAEHLALLGHQIIAVGRNQSALETLQQHHPKNITAVVADINKKEDRQKIKMRLNENDKGIFLVHNAGIAEPKLLAELTEEDWDNHYNTNMRSPLFLTQLLLPYLANGGRVLNISTGLAHRPMIAMAAYGVSKGALFLLKEYFNVELKEKNIAFASAMPGVVDTPIQNSLRNKDLEEFPAANIFKQFFQRNELLSPETVAKFLSWLLLNVDNEKFSTSEWDIYDSTHHNEWAKSGEINKPT